MAGHGIESATSTGQPSAEIEGFLDDVGTSLQSGLLPAPVYGNEDLFDLEQDRVFNRT